MLCFDVFVGMLGGVLVQVEMDKPAPAENAIRNDGAKNGCELLIHLYLY